MHKYAHMVIQLNLTVIPILLYYSHRKYLVCFFQKSQKVKTAQIGVCLKSQPKLMHKLSLTDKKILI